MSRQQAYVAGQWREGDGATFRAQNPSTGQEIAQDWPVSGWGAIDEALAAAAAAFGAMWQATPEHREGFGEAYTALPEVTGADRAEFLEAYADRLDAASGELVAQAHEETALPAEGRLKGIELPRTTGQLRQAAAAAREGSWKLATLDTKANIRSRLEAIGPVVVFGPNNFPFAFNGASGGDFAAAIAAGNPVIVKGNPAHPGTTALLVREAVAAAAATGMPESLVQLIHHMDPEDGFRMVADRRVGAVAYTGAKGPGLKIKHACDRAGVPCYLELGSVNPVVILPGALRERSEEIVGEFKTSGLMASGQFCTNPGLVLLLAGDQTEGFVAAVADAFGQAPTGMLLGGRVKEHLAEGVAQLVAAGAEVVAGGGGADGVSFQNTLLRTSGAGFLADPHGLQTEAFGNAGLCVVCDGLDQLAEVVGTLEGQLTGCVYSHSDGSEEHEYRTVERVLVRRVGRLLNDKMPTGVAVSPAMNHGGPYPASGHPGFTAVGIPASLRRFAALRCYDNVRPHRLPVDLRDQSPPQRPWRLIDGDWTR